MPKALTKREIKETVTLRFRRSVQERLLKDHPGLQEAIDHLIQETYGHIPEKLTPERQALPDRKPKSASKRPE